MRQNRQDDETELQRIQREASDAFARAVDEGRTVRRRAEPCATCGGQGWIDDPAHPIGGSYEDFLAAGPTPWIDCPDCAPQHAPAPASAPIGAGEGIYTSEPLPGRQSAFHTSDGRYFANAEDARRAQLDLDELAALEAQLTAAGDAAERLHQHRYALTPAGRALVDAMRAEVTTTLAGRAALFADRRQAVAP